MKDQDILPLPSNNSNNDAIWNKVIVQLQDYTKLRKWKTYFYFDTEDISYPEKKTIILNKRHRPEILCYYFLHEIGHLIMVFDDKEDYKAKYKPLEEHSTNSQIYRVLTVELEICAWNEGLKLAKSLNIPVNQTKFNELKASSLATYMVWAMSRKMQLKKQIKDS